MAEVLRFGKLILSRTAVLGLVILMAVALRPAHGQQAAEAHQVPVVDGGAGSCSVEFLVTDEKGTPVYNAKIRVHIAYGFVGARKLDLEAATNIDGKAQFKGIPEKVRWNVLTFTATHDKTEGTASYEPAKGCTATHSTIVLKAQEPSA